MMTLTITIDEDKDEDEKSRSLERGESVQEEKDVSDDNHDGRAEEGESDEAVWTDGDLRMLKARAKASNSGKTRQYATMLKFLNRSEEECNAKILSLKGSDS